MCAVGKKRFLVVLFSFKVKMPDSYSDVFFLPTTDLTRKGPLFTETSETTKAKSGQRKLSAMGPSSFFLLFQRNLQSQTRLKRPPSRVFWYFATKCMVINPKWSPLLHFLALCERKQLKFFSKNVFFLFPIGEKVVS